MDLHKVTFFLAAVICTALQPPNIVPELHCYSGKGAGYRGRIAVTESGKKCQRWSAQRPHQHSRTPENYPGSGLEHNYCRNPDNELRPWCYTTDPGSRWEYCPVRSCANRLCFTGRGAAYRGTIAVTESGKTCQRWSDQAPHQHSRTPENYPRNGLKHNYCRNPDHELRPWCYTTDPESRWEYCPVPNCTSLEPPPIVPELNCFSDRGAAYRGTIAVTESGKRCQRWSSQVPHHHTRTPENFPHDDLEHNYCRNPDNEMRPWCYTTDPDSRWEYCDVPRCNASRPTNADPELYCYTGRGAGYRGPIAVTESGKTCQRWSAQTPHQHGRTPENNPRSGLEHNYCRNPDNELRPWCYTTDSRSRWEYCAVRSCTGFTPPAIVQDLTCFSDRGATYRGTMAETETGKTCQSWSAQTPHQHDRTPGNYPSDGLEHNYCRNPDNELRPWCYTTDSGSRWEYCPIPRCTDLICYTGRGAGYRGAVAVTESGKTCQRWSAQSPHQHDRTPQNNPRSGLEHNYCRNPDNVLRPWCYTTDSGSRWEYCPVPDCASLEPPPEVDCFTGRGAAYRGTIAVSESGKVCQKWSVQTPHEHSRTPENNPRSGLQYNYCRNPDNEMRPWCYTTNPDSRWEYCGVRRCTDPEPAAIVPELTCYSGLGVAYRGTIAVTESGKTCQKWSDQTPHQHDRTPENYPGNGLEHNYCRNPDNEMRPWCYTTDSGSRWEYCGVPKCTDLTCFTGGGSEYRGTVAVTASGKTCQSWSVQTPHKHDRTPENNPSNGLENNYCRNPDNEQGPWCYTIDPESRWEYCDVPRCTAAFNCGIPVIDQTRCLQRIVGGCVSSPHSWPWQISLRRSSGGHFCGGTLIDPQWVLTAAHCLDSSTPSSAYSVYLGIHTQRGSESSKQERRLKKLVLSPNGADIALLKLESPVSINSEVMPACLPDKDYVVPHGTKCYATGWGDTRGTGGEGHLKQARVPVIENEICNKPEYLDGKVKDHEMCAGYDEGGVDTCQGDSGGPLVTYAQNRYVLQGVTSWGYGCANAMKPGVYARVSKFIDWIKRTINAG